MNPEKLKPNSNLDGSKYIRMHRFASGVEIPLYEVTSTSAFSQIIGHAKFLNAKYGNVYYRSVTGLYDNMMPSVLRGATLGKPDDLLAIITTVRRNLAIAKVDHHSGHFCC